MPSLVEQISALATAVGAQAKRDRDRPSYVPSTATGRYDRRFQVYNYKGSNTQNHAAGIAIAGAGGLAGEVFVGDSLFDGATNLTGPVFDRLHAIPMIYRDSLGVPAAGTGLVRVQDNTWNDDRVVYGSGWNHNVTNAYSSVSGSTITFTSDLPSTAVSVAYATGAGTGGFTVTVDGVLQNTVGAGSGAATAARSVVSGLAMAKHVVVVTTTSTTLTVITGFEAYNTSGFVAHNVAQGGSKAVGTGNQSWSDLTAGTSQLTPTFGDPVVYSTAIYAVHIALGGNDVATRTAAQIQTGLTTVVGAWRAAFPNADIFLHMIQQANTLPVPANQSTWDAFWSMMFTLADTLDVPLYDWQAMMGGYAKEVSLAETGDALAHLNRQGYANIGRKISRLATVGQTVKTLDQVAAPLAAVTMAGQRLTNLADGTAKTDTASFRQTFSVGALAPSGNWTVPPYILSAAAAAVNTGFGIFHYIDTGPKGGAIQSLGCYVGTAQVGGTTVTNLAIYPDDGSGAMPDCSAGPLFSGTVVLTTTGLRTLAAAVTLPPGRYWVVFLYVATVAPGTAPTVVAPSNATSLYISNTNLSTGAAFTSRCIVLSGITALPTSQPAVSAWTPILNSNGSICFARTA